MTPRAPRSPARGFLETDRALVIAHRGASAVRPENTLSAFRRALEDGADLVELDTRHSRDGVPMVFHDKELGRTTDAASRFGKGKHAFDRYTRAELQGLDAASWFDPRFAGGSGIPTLAEALDLIQPRSTTLIERKTGDAKTMIDLLRRKDLLDRVVVQSFDWDFLADCRALAPDLVLGALGSKRLDAARLAEARAAGAQVIGWNHKHVDADFVARVHAAGLKLWVYTVNDLDRARALTALGVDGLITDRPAAVRAALEAEAGR